MGKATDSLREDIAEINDHPWNIDSDAFLEEVKRLYEEEEDRRKVADAKATNFLLVIAALMSVLTYFEGAIWGEKVGPAPLWLMLPILAVALVYVIAFGYWVFRTLKLVAYHRVGTNEIVKLANGHGKSKPKLIRCYLQNIRHNQDVNNQRLTYLKMAHEFAFRAFIAFAVIVLAEAAFGTYKSLSTQSDKTSPEGTKYGMRWELKL